MTQTREENAHELARENEPTSWIDYSVGEREAHYRVYVGPTLAEKVTKFLRERAVQANAGTSHVYVVTPNVKGSRAMVLEHVRAIACCVTDRDITVLK